MIYFDTLFTLVHPVTKSKDSRTFLVGTTKALVGVGLEVRVPEIKGNGPLIVT